MCARHGQQDTVTLLGVGDVGRQWDRFGSPETICAKVAPVIRQQADIAFAQMEETWTKKDWIPILVQCGFNVVSVASNHTWDHGPAAFLDHIENLRQAGIAVVGGGRNIQEARAPAILERKGIRVAFLAYVSVIPAGAAAREHAAGMAPLRAATFYGVQDPQPGMPPRILTIPYLEDLEALVEDVRKARAQADVVVLSLHWGLHQVRSLIADYQIEVAHAAIDAGADLILGHHAHILKGIEVYKGKTCFYSLGNFLMAMAGLSFRHKLLYNLEETGPARPLHAKYPDTRMSSVAKCLISREGVQRVSYLPVWINEQAQPRILSSGEPEFEQTVNYLRDVTEDYFKTAFQVEGDEVVVSSP